LTATLRVAFATALPVLMQLNSAASRETLPQMLK
jgi:hypothetical protein